MEAKAVIRKGPSLILGKAHVWVFLWYLGQCSYFMFSHDCPMVLFLS